MPQPTASQVHAVNVPLTNIAISYANRADAFVAPQVFPRVAVPKMSDRYYVWTKGDLLRSHAQKRAEGTPAARSGVGLTSTTFTCLRDALARQIPWPVIANADPAINLEVQATEWIMQQMMIAVEVDFATNVFATSTWTGSSTAGDLTASPVWSNDASTPIEDHRTQAQAILENNGIMPNTAVYGAQTFKDLIDHPDILDRIKYAAGPGNPAVANENTLAQLLGLDRIFVARATRNTAAEGATAAYDFVLSQARALLCYVAPAPGIMVPSAGYTFVWNDGQYGVTNGVEGIRRYEDVENESVIIEGGYWYDHKVVAGSLGAYWTVATS